MSRTRGWGVRLAFALLAAAPPSLAVLLSAPASRADGAASASAAASAPAAASAQAAGAASASASGRGLPTMSDDPPGEEKSKEPAAAEWKEATRIAFDRVMPKDCDAKRVREWVRLTCLEQASVVAVVAGPVEGFSAVIGRPDKPGGPASYRVQFPVRRGEQRLIEVKAMVTEGYMDEQVSVPRYYLNVSWPEGDVPRVLAQAP